MSSAEERRKAFVERAGKATVVWRFFDAQTALHPDLNYDEARAVHENGRALQRGELGCYSSHYTLWRQLLESDADQYVILEDDVIIDWAFMERFIEQDFAGERLDYVRLYYKRPVRYVIRASKFVTRDHGLVELFGRPYGTQGYVITKSGAQSFVDACADVLRPVDDEMDRSWSHGVSNLAVFPSPIIEESVISSIGMERFRSKSSPGRVIWARRRENWILFLAYLKAKLVSLVDRFAKELSKV